MRAIIATVALCLFAVPAHANLNNSVMKHCLQTTGNSFDSYDFTKAAACYQDWKAGAEAAKLAELRDFLKHNPRYKVPGQSLNKCWGKPREMPFESSYIRVGPNGMEAGVSYKDTLPAGCYENAPWDNRDVED